MGLDEFPGHFRSHLDLLVRLKEGEDFRGEFDLKGPNSLGDVFRDDFLCHLDDFVWIGYNV